MNKLDKQMKEEMERDAYLWVFLKNYIRKVNEEKNYELEDKSINDTLIKVTDNDELWNTLSKVVEEEMINTKENLLSLEKITKEYELSPSIKIIDEGETTTYDLIAILRPTENNEYPTGVYYSDEDNENLLYTIEDVNEINKDMRQELAIEGVFVSPEWDNYIFNEMIIQYDDGNLLYVNKEQEYNIKEYMQEVGQQGLDDIRESLEASKKKEEDYEL